MKLDMTLSYTAITTHRQCPQKYVYKYDRRLEKIEEIGEKTALVFGQWWHALRAADSIRRGVLKKSLKHVPERIAPLDNWVNIEGNVVGIDLPPLEEIDSQQSLSLPTQVMELAEQWWNTLDAFTQEAWNVALGDTLVGRLKSANAAWQEQWNDQIAHEAPLAIELYWERLLPNGAKVMGYIDEIYLDERRNLVVVRDHKTHKELKPTTALSDMMDSQLQLYAYGAAEIVASWCVGPIAATSYDRVKMVAPQPPTLTKSGRLSLSGGKPSLGGTDLVTYVNWARGENGEGVEYPGLKKDGSGAGFYQAEESVITELKHPDHVARWLQRTLVPVNHNVIRAHVDAAAMTSFDIENTLIRTKNEAVPGRNLTKDCGWCEFSDLCRAEIYGGMLGEYDLEQMNLRAKPERKSGRAR